MRLSQNQHLCNRLPRATDMSSCRCFFTHPVPLTRPASQSSQRTNQSKAHPRAHLHAHSPKSPCAPPKAASQCPHGKRKHIRLGPSRNRTSKFNRMGIPAPLAQSLCPYHADSSPTSYTLAGGGQRQKQPPLPLFSHSPLPNHNSLYPLPLFPPPQPRRPLNLALRPHPHPSGHHHNTRGHRPIPSLPTIARRMAHPRRHPQTTPRNRRTHRPSRSRNLGPKPRNQAQSRNQTSARNSQNYWVPRLARRAQSCHHREPKSSALSRRLPSFSPQCPVPIPQCRSCYHPFRLPTRG